MKTVTVNNPMRWVLLLSITAVVVPTVCLLWFVNRAVESERLAVRARLEAVYLQQCRQAGIAHLSEERFGREGAEGGFAVDGLLVYDANEAMVFPVSMPQEPSETDPVFEEALRLEHVEKDYAKALEAYRAVGGASMETRLFLQADIGKARCLYRLGRPEEAMGELEHAIHGLGGQEAMDLRMEQWRAKLMQLEISRQTGEEKFRKELNEAFRFALRGMTHDDSLRFVGQPGFLNIAVPSPLQAFFLNKCIEAAETLEPTAELNGHIERARRILSFLTLSMTAAQQVSAPASVERDTPLRSGLLRLDTKEPLYGRYERLLGQRQLVILTRSSVQALLRPYVEAVEALPAVCRITDEQGELIVGQEAAGQKPFLTVPLESEGQGWMTEIYVKDDTFEQAAQRQAAVYVWSGALMAVLVLISGGVLTGTLVRQQRMNRLKNDFIATVTHELKTPLASMRLLVDTLREGRYESEATVSEYLGLIAGENRRLTHLIDSFLTFSRMERGKTVFDFEPVLPGEIAAAATEAMRVKLSGEGGAFSCAVDEGLKPVMADKDAMVMVLVNLLDNAWKYTEADKQIELRVTQLDGKAAFIVKDNGIGISPRAQRKIFQRFYQVDRSLSRSAEGCGLGLSIVEYIVEAHRGTIDVKSSPGKGSVFTVRLEVIEKS